MLSPTDLLHIWEKGQQQHYVDRALTILIQDNPKHGRQELVSITIGERDRRLLALRERIFGQDIYSTTTCPECHERVEFELDTATLRTKASTTEHDKDSFLLNCDDYSINFRLLTSLDLAAIAGCANEASARELLLKQCVLDVHKNGTTIGLHDISDQEILKLQEKINELDPQAEILLDLKCPGCGIEYQMLFDIATFLWEEIDKKAMRLLEEVHILASSYKWSEKEILSLSPERRRFYIERITL